MDEKYVYILNVSDSAMDLTTTGVFLEKGAYSKDSYDRSELERSSEIRKFVNLKFIQLLTQAQLDTHLKAKEVEAIAKKKETDEKEFFDTMEPPKDVTAAVENLEKAFQNLKDLLAGKTPKKSRRTKKADAPEPEQAQEAAEGGENAYDDGIPEIAPTGMEPMNDPVKRLLGRPPYTNKQDDAAVKEFITGSMDLGMLREMATFLKPGPLKTLARKKLREASAVLGA